MYSVVLMAALTTSVDLPDHGRRGGGCSGSCYGGCYGGGGGRGGHGRRGGGGCCGCYGGGYGYGYGGCYGSGFGYGGCYGGFGGGYGGCMGFGHGGFGYGGCYGGGFGYGGGYGGCTGMGYGGGCYGGGYGYGGGVILQGGTGTGTSGEKIQKKPTEKGKEESMLPAPATILVDLPADAKLFIDNEATSSTGSSRAFQSPVLNANKEYHYTLKAEVIRDGKPVKAEKVVTVKAGEITPVTLTLPAAGVAQR